MNLKDIAQLVTDKISSRQVTLQDYVTTASCCDRTYITLSPTLNCAILIFIQTRICHRTGRSNRTSGQGHVSCPAPCGIPQGLFLLAFFVTCFPLRSAGNYPSHSIPLRHAGSLVPCALWCATQAQQRPCRGHPSFVQGQSM